MTHRLTTNYAKNYCNRTRIVKVIVENVVTCFFWHTAYYKQTPISILAVGAHQGYTVHKGKDSLSTMCIVYVS